MVSIVFIKFIFKLLTVSIDNLEIFCSSKFPIGLIDQQVSRGEYNGKYPEYFPT